MSHQELMRRYLKLSAAEVAHQMGHTLRLYRLDDQMSGDRLIEHIMEAMYQLARGNAPDPEAADDPHPR